MNNYSPSQSKANSDCIYTSSDNGSAELRKKSSTSSTSSQYKNIKYLPRPMTVGGIPSSLPSPEYINVASDSPSYHTNKSESSRKAVNHSANMSDSKISKEFTTQGHDKDQTTSSEQKNNPEYHNLMFEQGKFQSDAHLNSNLQPEIKTTKGNINARRCKYFNNSKINLVYVISKHFILCTFQLQCQSQELKFHLVQFQVLKQHPMR